jgi:hypothetical protein
MMTARPSEKVAPWFSRHVSSSTIDYRQARRISVARCHGRWTEIERYHAEIRL